VDVLKLMSGNDACAEGAIYAGCRFFAGYPITPSSEIADALSRKLPAVGGTFIQMEDEIASIAACIGASMAGVKSMTATSGPGFSLMQENIGYAVITETPVVIVNVMRTSPSTGMPTGTAQGDLFQARFGSHGDYPIVALAPATANEMFELTVKAFNISEEIRTPVVLLPEAVVAHIREPVRIPEPGDMPVVERKKKTFLDKRYFARDEDGVARPPILGNGYRVHYTSLVHTEEGFFTSSPQKIDSFTRGLMSKLSTKEELLTDFEQSQCEDAHVILVSFGVTARACQRAARDFRKMGYKVGYFRPRIVWPFPAKELMRVAQNAHTIIVPELNFGQMKMEVERIFGKEIRIVGINKVDGTMLELSRITSAVREAVS